MSRRNRSCCPCTDTISANVATCGPNAAANLFFCPGYGVGPNLCNCACPPPCIIPAVRGTGAGGCCPCPRESADVGCHCHCRRRGEDQGEEGAQDQRRRRCHRRCCCRPCPSGFRPSGNYWGRCHDED